MQLPLTFEKRQAEILQTFLAAPGRSGQSVTYCEAVGFLYVVVCSPEMINPSEWLPVIISEDALGDFEEQKTQEVLGALMSLYNELNRQVQEFDVSLPSGCRFHDNPEGNFNADAPMRQWCRGFVGGHQWLEDVWNEHIPEAMLDEFGALFVALSFFADREAAAELHGESGDAEEGSLAEMAADLQTHFPAAMASFAQLSYDIQSTLREQTQAPARSNKTGRNEPCPCGSGKKYKKCCALKLH
jgi:uncharacterized protein